MVILAVGVAVAAPQKGQEQQAYGAGAADVAPQQSGSYNRPSTGYEDQYVGAAQTPQKDEVLCTVQSSHLKVAVLPVFFFAWIIPE